MATYAIAGQTQGIDLVKTTMHRGGSAFPCSTSSECRRMRIFTYVDQPNS
jgi:hypothetical protein